MMILKKIKLWHLTPLALLALIGVAVLIWVNRGDFSTRDIVMRFEGAVQVENGQEASLKLVIENNSERAIEDLNFFLDLPSSLILQTSNDELVHRFTRLDSYSKQEEEFKVVASSTEEKETIRARIDYSPQDIEARFVTIATHELVIGSLDVSVVFDLPESVFVGQEFSGVAHILAHSNINNFPVFARLVAPRGFKVSNETPAFERDNIWALGELSKGSDVKLEFSGVLEPQENQLRFIFQVGKVSKGEFLPLKVAERSVKLSSSAVTLSGRMSNPSGGLVLPGDAVNIELTYANNSDTPVEDAKISVVLPTEYISISSINSSGNMDTNGLITWDKTNAAQLRFIDPAAVGKLNFSFNLRQDLSPQNISDTNKFLAFHVTFDGGGFFKAEDEFSVRLGTQLGFNSVVLRNGSSLDTSGPIPPRVGELTTYAVKWTITNGFNRVRNTRVEMILPTYGAWQGVFVPSNENVRYNPSANTVVWEPGTLDVGLGSLVSARTVEFKIGIIPTAEHRGEIINVLEYVQFSGLDVFTDQFIERNLGEVRTILPDDATVDIAEGVVQ